MTKIKVERVIQSDGIEFYRAFQKVGLRWWLDDTFMTHSQMLQYVGRWLNFSNVKFITTVKDLRK